MRRSDHLRPVWSALAAVACVALPAGSEARAATFPIIGSGPNSWTVLDPATVTRDPATQRSSAWSVTVQRNLTNSLPAQPGYIRTLNEYDCTERRLRWRTFTAYSRYGAKLMSRINEDSGWTPAMGEGDASLRVVCEGAGGGAVVSAPSVGQLVLGLMSAWEATAAMPPLQTAPPAPIPHKPAPKR